MIMYTIKLFVVMVQSTSIGLGQAVLKGLPWKNGRIEIPKRNESFLYARRMSSFLRFLL